MIVSLLLHPDEQDRLGALRRRHFPADRLVVGAHVTVFHALPDDLPVLDDLRASTHLPDGPVEATMTGVRSLGRGVALTLSCPPAQALRADVARRWADRLTAQDAHTWSPHVTVQNKVTPAAARVLLEQLSAGFEPRAVEVLGLSLWDYVGGPWRHVEDLRF